MQHHLLRADPFSYTPVIPGWTDLHWIFQLLCYCLYAVGAERALIIFKLAAIGLTVLVLCLTGRDRRYLLFCAFLAPVLFYQVRYLVDVRPVLVTMICIVLFIFLFEHARAPGKQRLALWCIPLQILWTNCQGLFMIGLFIAGAYWIESAVHYLRTKQERPVLPVAVLLGCAAACLVNPYGFAGLLLPFRLFSRIVPGAGNIFSLNISENVPLFALSGYDAVYRPVVLVTAAMAFFLFLLNRKNLRIAHIILFSGFLFLACSAARNVLLYVISAIPVISCQAAVLDVKRMSAAFSRSRQWLSGVAAAAAAAILIVLAARHAAVVALFPARTVLSPFRFPEQIVAEIKRHPVPGNMFNDIRYGGYLIWHLFPAKKVFIDTRLAIRSPAFFAEYLALSERPELFQHVADKFNITHAVLPSALFTRHMRLIRWLYRSGRWRLEYTDGVSVLFVRSDILHGQQIDFSDDETTLAVVDAIKSKWKDNGRLCRENLLFFSGLLDSLGFHDAAASVVRGRRAF